MILLLCTNGYAYEKKLCTGKNAQIFVDGESFYVQAYHIDGYHYFKLRDISYIMQETNTPFSVKWNDNRIDLALQKDENAIKPTIIENQQEKQEAVQTSAAVYVNQKQVFFDAYVINGYTYFQLRDLGKVIGFQVNWDDVKQQICITTENESTPITPQTYQQLLQKGIDVDWSGNKKGKLYYNEQAVKDLKEAGVSHVRIRMKDDATEEHLAGLDKQIQDCLKNGIIPIIAYHGGDFETNLSQETMQKTIDWWKVVSNRYKDYSHLLSFDLIIEVSDALNKQPDMLNTFYEQAVTEIRKTNPTRIIMISPRLRSDAAYLHELKIPTMHNGYLMAEWHFYASGPSKEVERKLWTTGTDAEKQLILDKIQIALDWQKETDIPTWVEAWMPGNYNEGNTYTVQEQVAFSAFMTEALTQANIPFAINSDTKFYDRETNQWIAEMQPVFRTIFSNT